MHPDLADAGLNLSRGRRRRLLEAGGIPADCVAWGNFSGGAALQTATGTSAGTPVSPGGITAGKAIRRSIAPGCPTLLEAADDSNDSATDFAEVNPDSAQQRQRRSPRRHARAPNATIDVEAGEPDQQHQRLVHLPRHARDRRQLRMQARPRRLCELLHRAAIAYSGPLAEGEPHFRSAPQRERNRPTPASYTWTVDTIAPDVRQSSPTPKTRARATAPPSPISSSETGSTFQCSLASRRSRRRLLVLSLDRKDLSTRTLADGEYTFEVRATDKAGNQSAPGRSRWEPSPGKSTTRSPTPPRPRRRSSRSRPTRATARPPPSPTRRTSRARASNASSTRAAFASCPAGGITYTGLANGPHTFQVRAIDPSEQRRSDAGRLHLRRRAATSPPPPSRPDRQCHATIAPSRAKTTTAPDLQFRQARRHHSVQVDGRRFTMTLRRQALTRSVDRRWRDEPTATTTARSSA